MSQKKPSIRLLMVAVAGGVLGLAASGQAQECTTLSPTLRKCTINRPAVTRQRTEYATVNYAAGNNVTIKATGCARQEDPEPWRVALR